MLYLYFCRLQPIIRLGNDILDENSEMGLTEGKDVREDGKWKCFLASSHVRLNKNVPFPKKNIGQQPNA